MTRRQKIDVFFVNFLPSHGSWVHDVEFFIQNSDGKTEGEMKANKYLISLVSEVFRAQFFGELAEPSKKEEEEGITRIVVEDATFAGFSTMIRFMYSGDESIVSSINDLDLLFEIFRLLDKYLLPDLKSMVETTIEKIPLSLNNYAEVIRIISRHEELLPFENLCWELGERCVSAVKKELKSADDCAKFWLTDYKDDTLTKLALMQKIGMCVKCSPPKF